MASSVWRIPTLLTNDHNWYLEAVLEGTKVLQYDYYTLRTILGPNTSATGLSGGKNLKARLELVLRYIRMKHLHSIQRLLIIAPFQRSNCGS